MCWKVAGVSCGGIEVKLRTSPQIVQSNEYQIQTFKRNLMGLLDTVIKEKRDVEASLPLLLRVTWDPIKCLYYHMNLHIPENERSSIPYLVPYDLQKGGFHTLQKKSYDFFPKG
jgi:hypothetical protein